MTTWNTATPPPTTNSAPAEVYAVQKQKKGKRILIVIGAVVFLLFVFVRCAVWWSEPATTVNSPSSPSSPSSQDVSEASAVSSEDPTPEPEEYTLGSMLLVGDLAITFGESVKFDVVENRYSDKNGETVVVLPVEILNLTSETPTKLNMFSYQIFGSKGTELESVSSYFDNSVDFSGDIRQGAKLETNFYFLYDGDGDYYFSFDQRREEVRIPVKKS